MIIIHDENIPKEEIKEFLLLNEILSLGFIEKKSMQIISHIVVLNLLIVD